MAKEFGSKDPMGYIPESDFILDQNSDIQLSEDLGRAIADYIDATPAEEVTVQPGKYSEDPMEEEKPKESRIWPLYDFGDDYPTVIEDSKTFDSDEPGAGGN